MIRGAIFDVDGTLLDSMGIWDDVADRFLLKHGITPEDHLSQKLSAMTLEGSAAYLRENYPLQMSETEIVNGVLELVRQFYYEEASLKCGIKEVLQYLYEKKISMVIATTGERECVEKALKRLEADQYFDRIFTCTEVGAGKTEPRIYQVAAGAIGASEKEILVFEDAVHAITTARKAGFVTVGVYDVHSDACREQIIQNSIIYAEDPAEMIEYLKTQMEE